jgi:hypothetical protein
VADLEAVLIADVDARLSRWRQECAGRPEVERSRLLLLALEREQIVAVAYREESVAGRVAQLDVGDHARALIRQTLVWIWKDEQLHAEYTRGLLLEAGGLAPALVVYGRQLQGAVSGWTASSTAAIRVSFMLGYDRADRSNVTDPGLVDLLARYLRRHGVADVAVLEAPTVYGNLFCGRSVAEVASYFGFTSPAYRIVDIGTDLRAQAFDRGFVQKVSSCAACCVPPGPATPRPARWPSPTAGRWSGRRSWPPPSAPACWTCWPAGLPSPSSPNGPAAPGRNGSRPGSRSAPS